MLELNDLHVHYGAVVALRGISLTVDEGELVALLGANGAGKTTALSTIAGVHRGRSGYIKLDGQSIHGLTPERIVRRGIAMVPENRDIFPLLTVEQNLRLGAFVRRDRAGYRHDHERMCNLFPILRERLQQRAGTLSGGEQQQLAIARALMSRPRLLLLDEPSLGLAPTLVQHVFQLIARLHEEGMTILMVEQNAREALKIANRAYLMHMGRVNAQGTPDELRQSIDMESVYLGGGRVSPDRAIDPGRT